MKNFNIIILSTLEIPISMKKQIKRVNKVFFHKQKIKTNTSIKIKNYITIKIWKQNAAILMNNIYFILYII